MKKFLLLVFMLMFTFGFGEVWAQSRTISGEVISAEDGSTLPGVNVVLKGTTVGTVTDIDGNWTLTVPSEGGTLVFSFVGLATREIPLGAASVYNVSMTTDVTELSEVVVVGYGTTLEKEFNGAASTIDSEIIERLPATSTDQLLQGNASGVQVTSSSGTPGGGVSVRVRGQTSISASNDPLYIIDGVPVVSGNLQQDGFGGQGQNALAAINPNDIESIRVLKDASSTAIYGARAANGVVLITTKRGKTGKTNIDFNYMRGVGEPTNIIDVLGADDWEMIMNEARTNDGLDPLDWEEVRGYDVDTDWLDAIFRTADIQQFNLSFSGGNESTRYFLSGSYRDEEGTIIGSGYQRGTMRLNLDHRVSESFEFGTSIGLSIDQADRIQNDNNIYGVLSTALLTAPNISIYVLDENGNPTDEYSDDPPFANPVRSALVPRYANKTRKIVSNTYLAYTILPGLQARMDAGIDWNMLTEDHYEPESTFAGSPDGHGVYNTREVLTTVLEPTLRYNSQINEKHALNAVVGATWQNRVDFRNSVDGTGFSRESLDYLVSAAVTEGSSYKVDYKFASLFGRIGYNYDERYFLEGTVRRDGSTRFGPDNQFGLFYAVAAGWNFTSETFMENVDWLTFGKLRASYGKTGNDRIGDFTYLGTWIGGANYLDLPASAPDNIANPALKWEETSTLDIGIALAFLDDRISLNVGYFDSKTNDLLWANPIPESTGFSSVQANIGDMHNWGWEIDATTVNVNTAGGFRWSTNFNISFLNNELVSLINPEPIDAGFASAIIEGYPMNTFYMYEFLGVDPASGNALFTDKDGNGIINANDRVVVGDYQPTYLGGITNSLSYKGFSFDFFFSFIEGVDIYNNNRQFMEHLGTSAWGMDASVLRRWQQPGDITDIPRAATSATVGLNNSDNSRFLEDGSYLRLKNVTLAYNFNANLLSKLRLTNLRIYFTSQNLLTFTKYSGFDPEVNVFNTTNTAQGTDFLTYPQSKMFLFGINIGL